MDVGFGRGGRRICPTGFKFAGFGRGQKTVATRSHVEIGNLVGSKRRNLPDHIQFFAFWSGPRGGFYSTRFRNPRFGRVI